MKRVLVTGGYGFIGSNFINVVLKDTNFIIGNIDNLSYASNKNNIEYKEYTDRYNFFELDICNFEGIKDVFKEFMPDVIINFAAESHVDNSILNPAIFLKTNVLGTDSLLRAARELTLSNKKELKFIHISTDEVFGDLDIDKPPSNEQGLYLPSSPYAASKAASDLVLMSFARTYDFKCILTNCSNNFGPRQHPEKLIPKVITSAMNNERIPIYHKGENIRDWIFVDDHIDCLLKIIDYDSDCNFERFNIGGGNQISNIEVVKSILSMVESKISVKNLDDLIEFVEDRPGHDFRYEIDCTKAAKKLNWQPKHSFHSALDNTVDWYLKYYGV